MPDLSKMVNGDAVNENDEHEENSHEALPVGDVWKAKKALFEPSQDSGIVSESTSTSSNTQELQESSANSAQENTAHDNSMSENAEQVNSTQENTTLHNDSPEDGAIDNGTQENTAEGNGTADISKQEDEAAHNSDLQAANSDMQDEASPNEGNNGVECSNTTSPVKNHEPANLDAVLPADEQQKFEGELQRLW